MRIAANAIRVSFRSGGGFETYVTNILSELAKIHPELDIFTLYPEHFPGASPNQIVQVGKSFRKDAAPSPQSSSAPDSSLNGEPRKLGLSGDALRMLWTQTVLPFSLVKGRYDLFFAATHLDALPFSPVKQVVNVQDCTPLVFPQYEHKYISYLQWVLPTVYRRADKLIAVSENTKRDLMRFYQIPETKIAVIPEAIDPYLFRPVVLSREQRKALLDKYNLPERFLLSVSSNLPHKNLPRLIEAYGQVHRDFDIPLVIIGFLTPRYQKEAAEIMKRLGLDGRHVRFPGHFSLTDLPAVYSACELFAFVSLYEGFGFPPLEAMACGAPVVVSNAASIPEVVGPAGVYVQPYQPDSIAQGMRMVLQNSVLRDDLIKKGLEQAKKFSWGKAAKETLQVFEEVAGP